MKRNLLSPIAFCLAFLIIAWIDCPASAQTSRSAAAADVAIVRERLVQSVLPGDPANAARLHELAAKYADALRDDGGWNDIDYADKARSEWKTAAHLQRTLVMAKSARLYRDAGKTDSVLEGKILRALRFWTDHDYQNSNWWWNQIGVPQLVGEIGCLLGPALPPDQREKIIRIMQRGDWQHGKWTGGNLTWGVTIQIVRGCLQNDPTVLADGYDRMYQEIRIVGLHAEGIQPDFSFHQHGDQLYNGGYGLAYSNDVGRFISYAWGTAFQIPPTKMNLFCAYLLDGQQWMMWGDEFDYSAIGREIVRPSAGEHSKWTVGPIDPMGKAYGTPHVMSLLAAEPTPWRKDLTAFSHRLNVDPRPPLVGNKQFWCSDYMVHRRPTFFTSVKMLSNRMINGEIVNSEGKKSEHLSDGANFLYLRGDEYNNIFPVWDWTKIPGTTAIQGPLALGGHNPVGQRGQTAFAGGVTDGVRGACAMDLHRGHLTAHKAWFFFDDCYACLGSNINLAGDAQHSVATDVNQILLHGPVFISPSPGTPGEGGGGGSSELSPSSIDRSDIRWVYHNGVGYIFAPKERVCLSAGNQTGRWSDIGAGSSNLVTLPVFDLWIDHGKSCHDASYQYVVLPGVSPTQTAQWSEHPRLVILANNQTQAVYDPSLKLAEIVFRAPASVPTPLGKLAADHACLLLIQKIPSGIRITAANPENQFLTLSVHVDQKDFILNLPGGNRAGSSVSASIP